MLDEMLLNLDQISIEILLKAIIVFVLTLMLKLPIKKTTIKFEETKRKAVNTTIILIPVVLSALICSVSSGLYFGEWFSEKVIQNAVSVYLLSFAIYSIFSRIKIVIVGIKSGKIKAGDKQIKKEIYGIKKDVSNIVGKVEGVDISEIDKKIEQLKFLRNSISVDALSLITYEDIDTELTKLESEKQNLTNKNKI